MADMIRTRFAPSPTGSMHIGNLRTALYAFLLARSNNGKFILRLEDTDQKRYVEGATEIIYDTLKEAGLIWDEGPLVGGDFGPYIQSKRKNSYIQYARKLIEENKAYYCFCSKERVASLKESNVNAMYDSHCLCLNDVEIKKNLDSNIPYVIRQKISNEGKSSFDDLVYGHIEIDNSKLDDQILIKADGMPTYNFANVIDDHLMYITHIIRGNEYIVSTPKYNLLYDAFGWEKPKYIHLPLIMKSSTEKFSKRDGSASLNDLTKEGFLTHTIVNFVALLGWNPGTNQEIFTLDELINSFSIAGINKSPSIFDKKKLKWMNSEYLKMLSDKEFTELIIPYLKKYITSNIDFGKISLLLKKRINVFSEVKELVDFIDKVPKYEKDLYVHKKMKTDEEISLKALNEIKEILMQHNDFSNDSLFEILSALSSEKKMKKSQILWPLRTALTGKPTSPGGATELAELFGKTETLKRINDAIALLEE